MVIFHSYVSLPEGIIPHAKIMGKSQNIPELNGGFQRNITYKLKIFQPRLMREEGNLILFPSRARAKRVLML